MTGEMYILRPTRNHLIGISIGSSSHFPIIIRGYFEKSGFRNTLNFFISPKAFLLCRRKCFRPKRYGIAIRPMCPLAALIFPFIWNVCRLMRRVARYLEASHVKGQRW